MMSAFDPHTHRHLSGYWLASASSLQRTFEIFEKEKKVWLSRTSVVAHPRQVARAIKLRIEYLLSGGRPLSTYLHEAVRLRLLEKPKALGVLNEAKRIIRELVRYEELPESLSLESRFEVVRVLAGKFDVLLSMILIVLRDGARRLQLG